MANNRRDDYPALTDPFGYAGEVELLEGVDFPCENAAVGNRDG